jgi:deoxyribonuclease V
MQRMWEAEQASLRSRLITADDFDADDVRHVAGADISFVKGDPVNACACLVVLTFPSLEVVWSETLMVELDQPYISGFLAFREAPHIVRLIGHLRAKRPDLEPQILFVDGNGLARPSSRSMAWTHATSKSAPRNPPIVGRR